MRPAPRRGRASLLPYSYRSRWAAGVRASALAARELLAQRGKGLVRPIAIAAAEIGIGLAIVLAVYRNRGTSAID
ncbi:hypothetical protein AB0B51_36890, partial [Streptomyces griseus]